MSTLVGGTGIIGQDIFCSFGNGKYTTFEGTEIVAENCLKARVKDLVVEGKTYQNLFNAELNQGHVNSSLTAQQNLRVNSDGFTLNSTTYTIYAPSGYEVLVYQNYGFSGDKYIAWANKIVWTNSSSTNNIRIMVRKPDNSEITVDEVIGKVILLEGDYTNTDLPDSIDGIESVAERENINLLKNVEWYDGFINLNTGEVETLTSYPNAKYSELIEINSNQLYKTNITENINGLRIRLYKADGSFIRNSGTLYSFNRLYQSGINYFSKIRLLVLNAEQYPLPITPYVIANDENINYPYPLKLKVNEEINPINLPIPLRSLPNGVADTIEGDKLVQRVGKVVLNGSENWTESSSYNIIQITLVCNHKPQQNVFISNIFNSVGNHDKEGVSFGNSLNLWINKDRLTSPDIRGAKQWLSENPVTIYYELATPIIHDLTVPQLSTAKGTNIITTSNNIKPKISMKVKVKKMFGKIENNKIIISKEYLEGYKPLVEEREIQGKEQEFERVEDLVGENEDE